ncbi:MAG TPA: DUF721 domain-containing protein [Elusimicrobiales bacterium]|nr:DUF721 domain-containing protein [Elusimicrobiales bacterium]
MAFVSAKTKKGLMAVKAIGTHYQPLVQKLDRLMLLDSVWKKEAGVFASHWTLDAVSGGTIYVKAKSSSAAQELMFRSQGLIRRLNKYFDRQWIREIKVI